MAWITIQWLVYNEKCSMNTVHGLLWPIWVIVWLIEQLIWVILWLIELIWVIVWLIELIMLFVNNVSIVIIFWLKKFYCSS